MPIFNPAIGIFAVAPDGPSLPQRPLHLGPPDLAGISDTPFVAKIAKANPRTELFLPCLTADLTIGPLYRFEGFLAF